MTLRTAQTARQAVRGAFTLMEMLVVVTIIVILAGGGTFYYLKYLDDAKIGKARSQIKSIEQAVEAYYIKNSEFPPNLQALAQPDPDGGRPYLDAEALVTPFGRGQQYQYNPAGAHNGGAKPDIWADTPRGQIGNWPGSK